MASQSAQWRTQDDLENDLWLYSEISDHDDVVQEPPSIAQWKAQVGSDRGASVFDTPHYHDDVTYVMGGRGRGGVSKIFKPGLPVKDPAMTEDDVLQRMIREVSGLGYSNELIEKSIEARKKASKANSCDFEDAETTEDTYSSSSSSRATPDYFGSSRSRFASPSTAFPPLAFNEATTRGDAPQVAPPPLSVILGRQRNRKPAKKGADGVREAESDVPDSETSVEFTTVKDFWRRSEGLSWRTGPRGSGSSFDAKHWKRDSPKKSTHYDIASSHDFPALADKTFSVAPEVVGLTVDSASSTS